MTLSLCMFSQYLPIFITAKLPELFHGPVAQSTSVSTRERMGTNYMGKKGQQPQLILVYSVSGQTPKTNQQKYTRQTSFTENNFFFFFASAQFTNSTKPVEETQKTECLTLLLLIFVEAGVSRCQSMFTACIQQHCIEIPELAPSRLAFPRPAGFSARNVFCQGVIISPEPFSLDLYKSIIIALQNVPYLTGS